MRSSNPIISSKHSTDGQLAPWLHC